LFAKQAALTYLIGQMKELFNDILDLEGVEGVLLFSFEGDLIFEKILTFKSIDPQDNAGWGILVNSLHGVKEADLVFERKRLFVRATEIGYLLIILSVFVPIAMVRLNCDILMPSLKPSKPSMGLSRFLRKKTRLN
jgi:hypothetical protein